MPLDDPATWDAAVANTPEATFCHLAGWRRVIEDVAGHECRYLAAVDEDGRAAGVLPLARVRSRIFGQHLVSLPFLNYGGPVGSADAQAALALAAVEEAERSRADSLLLRDRYPVAVDLPASTEKVTVLLELPATASELWDRRFNAKFRNKIKRPMRDGMEARFGAQHLHAFYEVWARNMRDLGTPVLPRRFFERIVELFPAMALVGAVYHQERPVAAGFGFVWRGEFEMTWSSSLREFGAQKPNMLLYWAYMEQLIARGVSVFNFGRSTPGSGTHEFKRSWGAADAPLPWIRWPASDGNGHDGAAMRLAVAAWRRLPVGLANRMGPIVAPSLPWW